MKCEALRWQCVGRAFVVGCLLLVAACSGRDDTVQLFVTGPEGGDQDPNVSSTPAPPDTLVGRQLAWIIDVVNRGVSALEPGEIEAHFDEVFLRAISHDQTIELLAETARDNAPLTFLEVSPDTSERSVLALVEGSRSHLTIGINVGGANGKITGLQFLLPIAAVAQLQPPQTWEAIIEELQQIAPRAQLLVAEVVGDSCQTLQAHAAERALALGTNSSLYVLAELARQVEENRLSWGSTLTVQDELKSLPSGELQTVAEGTELRLWEVAEKMFALSDNTATDHLLALLGRENVESALAATGHSAPALNVPFLTTRELFIFRLELTEPEIDSYLGMAAPQRREFLVALSGRTPRPENALDWLAPRRIDQVEWFASAQDLCRLMAHLRNRSQAPGMLPLADVLSRNPALPVDAAEFPYVSVKGGAEPGVLNFTSLVERADGKRLFVTVGLNDPSAPIVDTAAVYRVAGAIFELLRTYH